MKKTRLLLVFAGVALLLGAIVFMTESSTLGAAERCDIVTIRGRDNIEPVTLTVKKGDCVVWMNWTRDQDVSLSFKEGEKCVRSTKAPVGFKMDAPTGCYVAGWMGYGQTSSLVFAEAGTYNYDVQFKVGGKNSGTIIVK